MCARSLPHAPEPATLEAIVPDCPDYRDTTPRTPTGPVTPNQATTAIRELHASLLDRWNRRDAAGFAALFAPAGSVVGFDGSTVDGAEAIRAHLQQIFADHRPAAYVAIVREVRLLGPATALLRAVAGMVPPGQERVNPAVNAVQSLVVQQDGARWRIQLFQNTPAAFHGRPEAAAELTAELQHAADAMAPAQSGSS
jgi:uncharacterized protein (TIGR02246 family)